MGKKKSKSQKKAEKKIKKYYSEKKATVEQKAAIDTKRYQEDLINIMRDSGIAQTRATEDYIRNIGNIEANKSADVDDLNEYVKTQTGRTQEDLDTALAKESRRYAIEYDRVNQDLADRGLTFSERKDEQIAKQGSEQNVADINTSAARSFADISRYEAAKNRDIELKYGQQIEAEKVGKTRTLEDILNEQQKKEQQIQRGIEDVAFGKAVDIRDISYGQDTDIATTGQLYDQYALDKKMYNEQRKFNG